MNFSNLKALGASIGSSLQDLEKSLAQPLVQGDNAASSSSPRVSSPTINRISTSSPRPSLDNPSSPSSPSAPTPSTSAFADSFRERLRKQREQQTNKSSTSLDLQRKDSSESARKVKADPLPEPPVVTPAPAKEESVAPPPAADVGKEEVKPVKEEVAEVKVEPEVENKVEETVEEKEVPAVPTTEAPSDAKTPAVEDAIVDRVEEPPTEAEPTPAAAESEVKEEEVEVPAASEPEVVAVTVEDPSPGPTASSPIVAPSSPPTAPVDDLPQAEIETIPTSLPSDNPPPLSEPAESAQLPLPTDEPVSEVVKEEEEIDAAPEHVIELNSTPSEPLPVPDASSEPVSVEEAPTPTVEETKEEAPSDLVVPLQEAPAPEPIPEPGPAPPVVVEEPPLPKEEPVAVVAAAPPATPAKDPRLAEITTAYKQLQKLKSKLDKVVSDILPLSGVSDVEALEGELRNMKGKTEMSMAEVGRLTAQIKQQTERTDELRDVHRLESQSQSEQIDTLREQLEKKDAALKLSAEQLEKSEATAAAASALVAKGVEDYDKLKIVAKEEEEKRVKALSLLRALRQKLVKSEKDREEAEKERDALKHGETSAHDTLKADRTRFDQEIVSMRAAQELQLTKLRQSYERETQSIRAQHERDAAAKKGQFELEVITVKAGGAKELANKEARIQQLEKTVREVTASRDTTFDELQVRTAEMESSSTQQETLESRTSELLYELKEAKDRNAALGEEVEELRKARRDVSREDSNTRRLLAEAEARHEAKVRDLEARAKQLEKDRLETEEEMGRNLQDRLKEVERMRASLAQKDIDYAESVHSSKMREERIEEGETVRKELLNKLKSVEAMLANVKVDADKSGQAEAALREELTDRSQRTTALEARLEELQTKESSLRSNNKTLRDELRKLQSGVLLSEKQRNPGVGYFSSFNQSSSNISAGPGSPELGSPPQPSIAGQVIASGSPASDPNGTNGLAADEALNFEYLRNVILQFLEQPKMRPHLLSVLGVILHFTPSESRRLAAKAL